MTIQNAELFAAGFWDWAILDGCFGPTAIKPTDIDGAVERNGQVIFIETKRPGAKIPTGQRLMHDALVASGHSVLIVWGHTNQPVQMRLLTPWGNREYPVADTNQFRELFANWYAWADRQPRRGGTHGHH